jgi:Flp pilus assembly protein TadG
LVLIMVAFLMPALIAVAAIVIDLGQAYTDSRRLQNAADAASLAATRALDRVRTDLALPGTVDTTARRVAVVNGAESSRVTCTIIDWQGAALGGCSDLTVVAHPDADGVLVPAGAARPTIFARSAVAGLRAVATGGLPNVGSATDVAMATLTQTRSSAATVQPLVGQDAPLLACAFGQSDGALPSPDILVRVAGAYTLNPDAVGKRYMLHGTKVSACGLSSSGWKGVAGLGPFNLPAWLEIGTGDRAGPIRSRIAGAQNCNTGLYVGCSLVLPVCTSSNAAAGTQGQLFCEVFAAFRLVTETSNSQTFELLGPVTVIEGIGGNGKPGAKAPRLVKLIL